MHSEGGQTLTWHEECLQCSVCSVQLQMDNVVFRDKLFCKSCYIQTSLNRCRAGGENICSSTKIFAVCQVRGVRRLHHGRGLQLPRAVLARQLLRVRQVRRGVPRRQVPRAQRGEAL